MNLTSQFWVANEASCIDPLPSCNSNRWRKHITPGNKKSNQWLDNLNDQFLELLLRPRRTACPLGELSGCLQKAGQLSLGTAPSPPRGLFRGRQNQQMRLEHDQCLTVIGINFVAPQQRNETQDGESGDSPRFRGSHQSGEHGPLASHHASLGLVLSAGYDRNAVDGSCAQQLELGIEIERHFVGSMNVRRYLEH